MQKMFIPLIAAVMGVCSFGLTGGCASSGQDQNYKMLQEDRPMFDTRPDRTQPGESRVPVAPESQAYFLAAPAPEEPAKAQLQPTTQPAGDHPDPATASAVREALLVPGVKPSVTGLDRSHWPTVVVTPAPVKGIASTTSPKATGKKDCCSDDVIQSQAAACCEAEKTSSCCNPGAECCQSNAACCTAAKAYSESQAEDCCGDEIIPATAEKPVPKQAEPVK